MAHRTSLSPSIIEVENSTLHETKEDIRLDQLIPPDILEDRAKLKSFLEAYYAFMNMDEFVYQETETFNDVVLDNLARFRIPDPNNENNRFFTDETGADSTLVLTAPNGTTTNISLNDINVSITNGNELPGSLAESTSEVGKTFTVLSLNGYNGYTATLTTIVKYWVGPGPSWVMNNIEAAMDIDRNETNYLELMQKEIAAAIPRGVTVNKRNLYKRIIDFYKLRGSSDSIEIFFRLLFNDSVEVEFPYNETLVPSSGDWDQPGTVTSTVNGTVTASTTVVIDTADENIRLSSKLVYGSTYTKLNDIRVAGISGTTITLSDPVTLPDGATIEFVPRGTYLDNKGFLSYNIKLQDSLRYQKFSYIIKTGKNLSDWEYAYDKLVHPAGFIYFAEILIFLELVDETLTAALNKASMPGIQPGVIGPEDIPLLVEMFASTFLPSTEAKIHKTGTLSLSLKNGVISSITITDGGSGYTAPPVVTSSDSGTPSGFTTAILVANLGAGEVTSISITDGGEDYNVPTLSIAAPTRIVFDGSDFGLGQTVDTTTDQITLQAAEVSALPIGSVVTYDSGGNLAIGGLVTGQQYRVLATPTSTTIQLEDHINFPGVAINFSGAGGGTDHGFTGETATATASKTDGLLQSVTIVEPGYGYASAPSISFSGVEQSPGSGVAPTVTIGIDSNGRLDVDNVTINSEGGGWTSLFATVAANPNATSIASVSLAGLADKIYTTAPTIVFPEPQSKDADGNLLSSNVTATAEFTLDSEGEITGVNITNAGLGYIDDPIVRLGSAVSNEQRVKDEKETLILSLNHTNNIPTLGRQINPVQASASLRGYTLYDGVRLQDGIIGVVDSITMDNVGSGYTEATITFSGGGAREHATATATISSGSITGITVNTGGDGYTTAPTITITGDGSNAAATANMDLDYTITQQTPVADRFLPEHLVTLKNPSFRTIINNGYKQRKGTDNFFSSARLYNTNQTIEFLGANQIQTLDSTVINNYNTNTFVHIEE